MLRPGAPLAPALRLLSVRGGMAGVCCFSPVEPSWGKIWCLTLRLLHHRQNATQCPNWYHLKQAILGDLSQFGHFLDQCPTRLQIRHLLPALSFKNSGFAIGLPWRAASIWACLVSLLFSFSWALASLSSPVFYYKRYWWLSGPSHLKGQRGSAAVAVITVSWCLMHVETGICPLKSPVPCKSISPDK